MKKKKQYPPPPRLSGNNNDNDSYGCGYSNGYKILQPYMSSAYLHTHIHADRHVYRNTTLHILKYLPVHG